MFFKHLDPDPKHWKCVFLYLGKFSKYKYLSAALFLTNSNPAVSLKIIRKIPVFCYGADAAVVARSPYPGSTSADTAWSWGNSSLDNWLLVSSGTPWMFSWEVIFFIADKICPQLRPGFLIEMVDSLVTVPHSAKGRGLIDWFLKKKLHSGSVTQVWVLREPWCGQPLLSTLCWELGLIDFSKSLVTHDECWICTPGVGSAWCAENWIDWFLQKFGYTWWMLALYPRCGFCVMCWELGLIDFSIRFV